jgi:transposase
VGSKLHLLTDGHGHPLEVAVSAGQAHESRYTLPLLDQGAVRRPRGLIRRRPRQLAGGKGYSYPPLRRGLRPRGRPPGIPPRAHQRPRGQFRAPRL